MKFQPTEDGFITALRFYKQPNNTGTHVGHLWTARRPAARRRSTFTNETASGWQEERLAAPGRRSRKDTTYVTSYYARRRAASRSARRLLRAGVDRRARCTRRRRATAATASTSYGAERRSPTRRFNATNYWVDAVFDADASRRTRAPPRGRARRRPPPARPASRRRQGHGDVRRAGRPADRQRRRVRAQRRRGQRRRRHGRPTTRATRTATLTPTAPLAVRQDLHGDGQERQRRRGRPRRQPLDGRQRLDVQHARAVPVHALRADRAPRPAHGGRRTSRSRSACKFRPTEDGFITAPALLQAGEQHRHPRRPPVDGRRPAAGHRRRTPTRPPSGWQEVELPNADPGHQGHDLRRLLLLAAAATSPFEPGRLRQRRLDRAADARPADGDPGGNGVYKYGASGFPDQSYNATNYWVDATFERIDPAGHARPVGHRDHAGRRRASTSPRIGAVDARPSTSR